MVITAQYLAEYEQFRDPGAVAKWLLDLDLLGLSDLAFVEDLSVLPGRH